MFWTVRVFSPSLFLFFSRSLSLLASAMMKKKKCHRSYAPPGDTHSPPRSINGILAATSCLPGFVPRPRIQRDAGLDLTPAAGWRLLTDDGECWASLELWLMASVFVWVLVNEESSRRSLCLLVGRRGPPLYRNALIDIPSVLINKRTHTFADSGGVCFVATFFFFGLYWSWLKILCEFGGRSAVVLHLELFY